MKLAFHFFLFTLLSLDMQAQDICKNFFLNNKVVAHRGAWKQKNIPQNSVASLKEAFRLGCAGSEFDVRMTADARLVLCHDETFFGKTVEYSSYAELSETKLANGETIPLLDTILFEAMKQTDTRLFLEIKPASTRDNTMRSTAKIVNLVNTVGAQPWTFYITFDYDAAKLIKVLSPSASVAYLSGNVAAERLAADKITGLDYNKDVLKKDAGIAEKARREGLSLNVWTVNSPEDMDFFIAQGFDYITTDEPELLLEKTHENSDR
ncbi:MAG: glycerophosphodiester phosphodiesterase [Prevotellaceae bacterium]|jgi:glycerophosphoryl diester phosphodiesterase|nr:glycerophosphodiester phosphodiesterase [Prevotellaceae bacterium]